VVTRTQRIDESTFAFVRLTADDGTVGVGEISDIERPSEMPDPVAIEDEPPVGPDGPDPVVRTEAKDGEYRTDCPSRGAKRTATCRHVLKRFILGTDESIPTWHMTS
jgi:L-alanine-DL-glutamate epimerase-like enolase superfamily enzyme